MSARKNISQLTQIDDQLKEVLAHFLKIVLVMLFGSVASGNLSRAVQVSVDIGAHLIAVMEVPPPDSMGQTFDLLAQEGVLITSWQAVSKRQWAFRNIAVHGYEHQLDHCV